MDEVATDGSHEKPSEARNLPAKVGLEAESGLALAGGSAEDVVAFTKFYLATRASLRGYLGTMLHNDAACEDCMQEAVLVVWNKRQEGWELEDFRRMAFTCAKFKALSWLKKHKPAKHLNLSPELSEKLAQKAADAASVAADYQLERIEALRACVEDLPSQQRALVKARYEEMDAEELARIAAAQNKKMNAVYKQLERTRAALKQCVERKMGGGNER